MPDQGVGVTYPVLATAPNGDVYMMARIDNDAAGTRQGRLYRWNNAASTGLPIERLAVERDPTGVDVLYLADIGNSRLYYGRN